MTIDPNQAAQFLGMLAQGRKDRRPRGVQARMTGANQGSGFGGGSIPAINPNPNPGTSGILSNALLGPLKEKAGKAIASKIMGLFS
tara:strand:+ start:110 stop:367 length:258 start_codon:yes stop_codon:yes gene_type:complete